MSGFDLKDYVDVAERIGLFYAKYPDGSIQTEIVEATDRRVTVRALAFRSADDQRPGTGHSWLGIPGTTPYTKGSELENAETSAVGRAIAMLGFAVKGGIASRQEVMGHSGDDRPAAGRAESDGSLIGTVTVADKAAQDFSLRQTPEGHALGFRLKGDRGSILVRCADPLASQLAPHRDAAVGALVTCWGTVSDESFTPKGGDRVVTYQVLTADRVRVPGVGDLPAGDAAQPQDRTEQEELDALAW